MKETSEPALSQRVDLTRETDVAYWCRILGVSADRLRHAVQHVGPDARDVQRYLMQKPAPLR